jgi:hypothetical protein
MCFSSAESTMRLSFSKTCSGHQGKVLLVTMHEGTQAFFSRRVPPVLLFPQQESILLSRKALFVTRKATSYHEPSERLISQDRIQYGLTISMILVLRVVLKY